MKNRERCPKCKKRKFKRIQRDVYNNEYREWIECKYCGHTLKED